MTGVARRDTLVVATSNRGKLRELRALLAELPVYVEAVADILPTPPHIVEDGATFAENAVKKARAVASATMQLTLADDSGLEVDALGGRPGVQSARFAHDGATDAENNAALLRALDGVPARAEAAPAIGSAGGPARGEYRARFRCVLALVDPLAWQEAPHIVEGVCEGSIVRLPRGSSGFGYDPFFVVAGTNQTMAELPVEVKNRLSHRARAFAAIGPVIEQALQERLRRLADLGAARG